MLYPLSYEGGNGKASEQPPETLRGRRPRCDANAARAGLGRLQRARSALEADAGHHTFDQRQIHRTHELAILVGDQFVWTIRERQLPVDGTRRVAKRAEQVGEHPTASFTRPTPDSYTSVAGRVQQRPPYRIGSPPGATDGVDQQLTDQPRVARRNGQLTRSVGPAVQLRTGVQHPARSAP